MSGLNAMAQMNSTALQMTASDGGAPRRQFIMTLSGPGYEIETSDGSVVQLPPG